jgi:hypothetical protein
MILAFFTGLTLAVSAQAAPRVVVSCKATKIVDRTVFQDGLSVKESAEDYDQVEVTRPDSLYFSVKVGALAPWSDANDDIVDVLPALGSDLVFEFSHGEGRGRYQLVVTGVPGDRIGKLFSVGDRADQHHLIAELSCN